MTVKMSEHVQDNTHLAHPPPGLYITSLETKVKSKSEDIEYIEHPNFGRLRLKLNNKQLI